MIHNLSPVEFALFSRVKDLETQSKKLRSRDEHDNADLLDQEKIQLIEAYENNDFFYVLT